MMFILICTGEADTRGLPPHSPWATSVHLVNVSVTNSTPGRRTADIHRGFKQTSSSLLLGPVGASFHPAGTELPFIRGD